MDDDPLGNMGFASALGSVDLGVHYKPRDAEYEKATPVGRWVGLVGPACIKRRVFSLIPTLAPPSPAPRRGHV